MADYIEGKRPVLEALRGGVPIARVMIAAGTPREGVVADVVRKARAARVPVEEVPRAQLEAHSERGAHQGVVAQAAPFPYASLHDVLAHASAQFDRTGRALVVLCDHITDAGNLGAIVRSAEAVGAAGLVLPKARSAAVTSATYKSSAGAIANLPVTRVSNLGAAIERAKEEGFWVIGASEKADEAIWDADLTGRIVVVMGNEAEGISRLVQQKCDLLAALPQVGRVSSLNVAQSATAVMYEWLRQNRASGDVAL